MLTLQKIITESDALVENGKTNTDKVPWLNALNQEFFDVVKIPQTLQFTSSAGVKTYTLSGAIKERTLIKSWSVI